MKNIRARWFTEKHSNKKIGIVMAEDEINGIPQAFIGTGHLMSDENADREKIMQDGARFPLQLAKILFKVS